MMSVNNDIKQVIIVRKDLDLPKGKLCVQVAHAAVSAFLETKKRYPDWAKKWLETGQKKIVVKVKSIGELLTLHKKIEECNLPAVLVTDAGLTVLPPGTITCLGVGPAPAKLVDRITKNLKLL